MSVSMATITSEKRFSDLWERSLDLCPDLIDRDGNKYEIVFPGIRNHGPGPDFKGAVLRRDGATFGGDVELHLEESGWRSHGHHRDPAYNGVALHVALKLSRNSRLPPGPPTAAAYFSERHLGIAKTPQFSLADIEELGVERFRAKSDGFRIELDAGASPNEAVYRGLMEAMGYARNRKPFLALAKAAPISMFEKLRGEPRGAAEFGVFAALATIGNVLKRVPALERAQIRRVAPKVGASRRLPAEAWSFFRVRPHNDPVNRMRSMAHLVVCGSDDGLFGQLRGEFERGGSRALVKWVSDAPRVGRGFALTVVSNALMPCLYAVAPSDRVISEFLAMRAPPSDSVTRGVSGVLGIDAKAVNAAQHFGLHSLAKSSSWPGRALERAQGLQAGEQ